MLCTECHVRKDPELAKVGFDPAALFDACEIKCEISLDKIVSKEAGKVILPIFVIQVRIIYFHVETISHYASVNFFSDSHGILNYTRVISNGAIKRVLIIRFLIVSIRCIHSLHQKRQIDKAYSRIWCDFNSRRENLPRSFGRNNPISVSLFREKI